jgi:hypothetical protein
MSFFDKAKQAAGQAAARVQEGVEDVQQQRELSKAQIDLGKIAFELHEAGEISHSRLDEAVAKIREVKAKIAGSAEATAEAPAPAADPSQPPAMPN